MDPSPRPLPAAADWDERYRQGRDGWELGVPAPPLAAFLGRDPRSPHPPGRVLVPGCGRGHEAALLAELGFTAIGLDFSTEALDQARQIQGEGPRLRWLQQDLFEADDLLEKGQGPGSLEGVVEHTCFCAIDPALRASYLKSLRALLVPGGWLLGLFWCHSRAGGPPWGSDPAEVAGLCAAAGFQPRIWEPARGSVPQRQQEWLGLWRAPPAGCSGGQPLDPPSPGTIRPV